MSRQPKSVTSRHLIHHHFTTMEDKTLESLNEDLFLLPEASMLQINGGMAPVETRSTLWTQHGGHQDNDGYDKDSHA